MKQLAVLVPALNESRRVDTVIAGLRNIQSVLFSLDVHVILVLIDDGSRDDTFEIFEKKLQEERDSGQIDPFCP